MQKVVHIIKPGEKVNDRAYWMSKSAAERLSAIEFLRLQYPDMKINFPKDFSEFVTLLEKYQVEYLVARG